MKNLKKYLFLLVPLIASADLNIEKVNSILSSIKLSNNTPVSYYSKNKTFINKLKVKKADSPTKANIVIFPKSRDNKHMFIVSSFEKLKNHEKTIGAIYLKKGRTQIMFVEERLQKRGLKLPEKYKKYLIKESYLCPLCLLNKIK